MIFKCIDKFEASQNDPGRTSVITFTNKSKEAKLFKHRLRHIPVARRFYLKQNVKRLLKVGTIFPAN